MNPLIGRTCAIVDYESSVPEGQTPPPGTQGIRIVRTPGIVMDLYPAWTRVEAGQAAHVGTDTWVLLVLLEGGALRCVTHESVVIR